MAFSRLGSLTFAGIASLVIACATTPKNGIFEPPTLNIETRITTNAGDNVDREVEVKDLYNTDRCSRPYTAIQFSGDTIKNLNGKAVTYPIGAINIIDCESYSQTVFFSTNPKDPYQNAYLKAEDGSIRELSRIGDTANFRVRKIKAKDTITFMQYEQGIARALTDYVGDKKKAKKAIDAVK